MHEVFDRAMWEGCDDSGPNAPSGKKVLYVASGLVLVVNNLDLEFSDPLEYGPCHRSLPCISKPALLIRSSFRRAAGLGVGMEMTK